MNDEFGVVRCCFVLRRFSFFVVHRKTSANFSAGMTFVTPRRKSLLLLPSFISKNVEYDAGCQWKYIIINSLTNSAPCRHRFRRGVRITGWLNECSGGGGGGGNVAVT